MNPTKDKTQTLHEQSAEPDKRTPPSVSPSESDRAGVGSLEKVQEILFGTQTRHFEEQLNRLENLLAQNLTSLRQEVQDRFATLESTLQREVTQLSGSLQTEHQTRAEIVQGLSLNLKETAKDLEAKLSSLDGQSSQGQQAIRQELANHQKALTGDIQQKTSALSMEFQHALEELKGEKADRMALATLFEEVAKGLSGELHSATRGRRSA